MNKHEIHSLQQANLNTKLLLDKQLLQIKQQVSGLTQLLESLSTDKFSHLFKPSVNLTHIVESLNKDDFSHLFKPSVNLTHIVKSLNISEQSSRFSELLKAFENLSKFEAIPSLEKTIKIGKLTEASFAKLNFSSITESLQKSNSSLARSLYSSFSNFSISYSSLTALAEELILDNPATGRIVSELPAIEMLNNVDVIQAVYINDVEDEFEIKRQSTKNELIAQVEGIESLLINIDSKDLIALWQGANKSLDSTNPDYARHFAVSFRELFTQILHRLSPTHEIKKWTNDDKLFDNGKPTRKARLLFICRSVNHDIFSDFLEKDVEAILELLKLFQRGTHQVIIPFTHKQLVALKARVESAIIYLIEISQLNK